MSTPGLSLLSALRRTRSKSLLFETPAIYFKEGPERAAFDFLRNYVQTYNAWPTPDTVRRETKLNMVLTKEPPQYYQDAARRKILWESLHDPYGQIKNALETKNPDRAIEIMRGCIAAASELSYRQEGLTTLSQSLQAVEDDYDFAKNASGLRGIPTGYDFLDEQTDGWQNSDVVSIVARPGVGKTAKLLKFASAAHNAGYSVLFLSMEMASLQLARRFFGIQTGYNPRIIRKGEMSTLVEREMRRAIHEMRDQQEVPFYWLAGNFKKTVPALTAAAHETGADLIIGDASYLLTPEKSTRAGGGRREAIADVIEQIGGLSKSVDRPVVQSVQFNRLGVKPKRGEDEEVRTNPVAHLTLDKIGETDTVGQVSAVVIGLEKGDPPHESDHRYAGLLKGREGEEGWYEYNYSWQPVNFDMIRDHTSARRTAAEAPEAPDLSYMDA